MHGNIKWHEFEDADGPSDSALKMQVSAQYILFKIEGISHRRPQLVPKRWTSWRSGLNKLEENLGPAPGHSLKIMAIANQRLLDDSEGLGPRDEVVRFLGGNIVPQIESY